MKKYGEEVREEYGEEAVKRSNEQFMNMTKQQYNELNELGNKVLETLKEAYKTGNPAGELGQNSRPSQKMDYTLLGDYSPEAHANLTQMYVDDERFRSYYDKEQPGSAEFLRDAVKIYTEKI